MARGDAAPAGTLEVAVAWSAHAGSAIELAVSLPIGATVLDAIRASGVLERDPAIDISTQPVGIWGRVCPLTTPLQQGDRVEIYRPLAADPKEARRLRAERDAALRAGTRRRGDPDPDPA